MSTETAVEEIPSDFSKVKNHGFGFHEQVLAEFVTMDEYPSPPKLKRQATLGKYRLFFSDQEGEEFIIINNRVYGGRTWENYLARITEQRRSIHRSNIGSNLGDFCGVEVNSADGRRVIIQDAEEGNNELIVNGNLEDQPTTSFQCLAQLMGGNAADRLADGKILLLDFTPDTTIDFTVEQKKQWREWEDTGELPLKRPKTPAHLTGFTAVGDGNKRHWHRSGTCLFKYKGNTYLTGQDEGTYFGVELAGNPKTIKDAFVDLIPKAIRGKPFQRQGEWFVIAVADKQVPNMYSLDIVATHSDNYSTNIALQREEGGNEHTVSASSILLTRSGKLFARDGELRHREHGSVKWSGWATFVKSTAKRSVSVEGVD